MSHVLLFLAICELSLPEYKTCHLSTLVQTFAFLITSQKNNNKILLSFMTNKIVLFDWIINATPCINKKAKKKKKKTTQNYK